MYPLTQALRTPAVSAGIGYEGSNGHAPNENIRLKDYLEGIRFVGELIRQFGTEQDQGNNPLFRYVQRSWTYAGRRNLVVSR